MTTQQQTTEAVFDNGLYLPETTRALRDAAGQLEQAAAKLREFAGLMDESIDPASITAGAAIVLPSNVASLGQSTQGYLRSANDSLFVAVRSVARLRPTV